MSRERYADVLIVGGGIGGVAAALAATGLGFRAILTEETDWLGGQLTSQAVPPDEHPWIESFGCTARYRRFRELVRGYYREHYPLLPTSRADPHLNPGAAYVSRIAHEPRVALAAIEAMLAYPRSAGLLEVLTNRAPVSASVDGDTIRAVELRDTRTGEREVVTAGCYLDATELGDLLPLAGVEYVVGAESRDETGEPHAVTGPAQPGNVQAITWCFPVAHDPGSHRVIDRPAEYDAWRDYVPSLTPGWPGRLLSLTHPSPITLEPRPRVLFPEEAASPYQDLWRYRRLIAREHYLPERAPHEVTLVNWPQNDYVEGSILDAPPDEVARHLEAAKRLSLSLLYWLQTEAPRPDGGAGYPGLYLRPDMVGTADGLAKYPYVREARRIRAEFTVLEQHVGLEIRGCEEAERFSDSVGVGCYRIDLHPSTGGDNYVDVSSLPFQIPLGSLVPIRVGNLLAAGKCLGVTHVTNGCYRLHPVEWNVGESAGCLAGFCLRRGVKPREVRARAGLLGEFQSLLGAQGIELSWPRTRPV